MIDHPFTSRRTPSWRPTQMRLSSGSILPVVIVAMITLSLFAGGLWMWLQSVTQIEENPPILVPVKQGNFAADVWERVRFAAPKMSRSNAKLDLTMER